MFNVALDLIKRELKEKTGKLDLGRCGLTELPKELFDCVWLEELSLSHGWSDENSGKWVESENRGSDNVLLNVPDNIQLLKNLKVLRLGGRCLNKPNISFLESLTNLRCLDISNNQIQNIRYLENLTKLTYLHLGHNQIANIEFLKKLSQISFLILRDNVITNYSVLRNLVNLSKLDLSENYISNYDFLKKLTKLSYLNLALNQIVDITFLFDLISRGVPLSLKPINSGIVLYGNPIDTPPPEVIRKGNDVVIRHLVRLGKVKKKDYLYEAKVILIGRTGSGKTSLRYKLRNKNNPLPAEENTTKGIDVETIEFSFDTTKTFRMNIWDFEGQQISQQTHQFFLTKRSLYIFVADQRTEKSDFDYWMQIVELLSDGCPMIIFHNEKNGNICDLNLQGIRKSFGHFLIEKDYRSNLGMIGEGEMFNAMQLAGFEEFRESLQDHLIKLPIVGIPIENSWILIRGKVEERARLMPFFTDKDLWNICDYYGVTESQDQKDLSQLFHDLGIFLHYQEEDIPSLLSRMIILQKDWATKAVYIVLKSEWLRKEKMGHFTLADLRRVWSGTDYVKHSAELLELMMKFELCYQVRNQNVFICPQILPTSPPFIYHLPSGNQMLLRFGYDFMPKGIITRLTVRLHKFIAENQTLAWKDGFVLEQNNTKAEVYETYGKKEIHIKVSGEHCRKLLNEIAYEVNLLNSEYHFNERIQSFMLLPCHCAECLGTSEPYFFKYNEVMNMQNAHWTQMGCLRTGNPVQISEILSIILEDNEREIFDIMRNNAELLAIRKSQESTNEHLINVLKEQQTITEILTNIENGLINEHRQIEAFQTLYPLVIALRDKLDAQKLAQIETNPEIKSKLKLVIPLLPTILSYETEFSWDWLKVKKSLRGLIL